MFFFFFKQKTAYEMRISDWSSDVCSSDLCWQKYSKEPAPMSRIGKKPISVPSGVTASIADGTLSVKGPKGTLSMPVVDDIAYDVQDGAISVQPANDSKRARA